jgi:hypothetical protein
MLDPTARDQRLLRRLREAGEAAPPLTDADRSRARALRAGIDHALAADDARRAEALPPDLPALPPHRDWTWRPALWRSPATPSAWAACTADTPLSPDLSLFHDCPLGEVAARQTRAGGPPFALAVDVYAFRGSYLSLAITLPPPALAGLRRRHVLRIDARLRAERPATVYARLNVQRGSTRATIVRELPQGAGAFVDFDLASLKTEVSRAERIWIDLILDRPAANAVTVEDIVLTRTPRAEV